MTSTNLGPMTAVIYRVLPVCARRRSNRGIINSANYCPKPVRFIIHFLREETEAQRV